MAKKVTTTDDQTQVSEITVPRASLLPAIRAAAQVTDRSGSTDIFKSLNLSITDGGMSVVGCNGIAWLSEFIPCFTTGDRGACVRVAPLLATVEKLPDGDVTLRFENGQLTIESGRVASTLPTLHAGDFPAAPLIDSEAVPLSLDISVLQEAITSVFFAAATDFHREILTGIYVNAKDGKVEFAATDTHRLALKRLECPSEASISAIIPESVCRAILALDKNGAETSIKFDGQRVEVGHGDRRIIAQLLVGTYPNIHRVIPDSTTSAWVMEREQVEVTLGRIAPFSQQNARRVRISLNEDELTFSGRSDEFGAIKDAVSVIASGEAADGFEIALNGRYFAQALSFGIHGPGVRCEFTTPTRPMVIRDPDAAEEWLCVIMPMALA